MTTREGAIISAYTNILCCESFDFVHEYIEEIMGRPVFLHEFAQLKDEIKKRSEKDFMDLIASQIEV